LLNWLFVAPKLSASPLGRSEPRAAPHGYAIFSFPVALTFTAIPWPDYFESPLTQGMMRLVALVAVKSARPDGSRGTATWKSHRGGGGHGRCERGLQRHSIFARIADGIPLFGRTVSLSNSPPRSSCRDEPGVAFLTNVLRAAFLAWNAGAFGPWSRGNAGTIRRE